MEVSDLAQGVKLNGMLEAPTHCRRLGCRGRGPDRTFDECYELPRAGNSIRYKCGYVAPEAVGWWVSTCMHREHHGPSASTMEAPAGSAEDFPLPKRTP